MENVNVVENVINASSKTKIGLKVIYLLAAQSFFQLIAELVLLLRLLVNQYQAVESSHHCSYLRFYYKVVSLTFLHKYTRILWNKYLPSSKLSAYKYVTHALVCLEFLIQMFSIKIVPGSIHKQLKYVRKPSISSSQLYLQDSLVHREGA